MRMNAVLTGAAAAAVLALSNPVHAGMLGGAVGGGLGGGFGGALGGGMSNVGGAFNGGAGGAFDRGAGGTTDSRFANPRFGRLNQDVSAASGAAAHGAAQGAAQGAQTARGTGGIAESDGAKGAHAAQSATGPKSGAGAAARSGSAPKREMPQLSTAGGGSMTGDAGAQTGRGSDQGSSQRPERPIATGVGYGTDAQYSAAAGRHPSASADGSGEASMNASASH